MLTQRLDELLQALKELLASLEALYGAKPPVLKTPPSIEEQNGE